MASIMIRTLSAQIDRVRPEYIERIYSYFAILELMLSRTPVETLVKADQGPRFFGTPINDPLKQLTEYQELFNSYAPENRNYWNKAYLAFRNKGQLADMTYIIEKMLEHTKAMKPGKQKTFNLVQPFLEAMTAFLESVHNFQLNVTQSAKYPVNAGISSIIAIAGLAVVLASAFSLAGVIIGGALIAGGGSYLAYSYLQQSNNLSNLIHLGKKIQAKLASLEKVEGLDGDFDYVIVQPTRSTVISMFEHLSIHKLPDGPGVLAETSDVVGRWIPS